MNALITGAITPKYLWYGILDNFKVITYKEYLKYYKNTNFNIVICHSMACKITDIKCNKLIHIAPANELRLLSKLYINLLGNKFLKELYLNDKVKADITILCKYDIIVKSDYSIINAITINTGHNCYILGRKLLKETIHVSLCGITNNRKD